jgi:adenosylmethionine-8-amino-7-oxononanoate aminotransferase
MLLLGKGISAGYIPFASVLIHPKVGDMYARSHGCDPLMHGHTFSGNPLACAAALKNIDVLSTQQMQTQIRTLQSAFETSLRAASGEDPRVHVRQRGLMAGIEVFSPEMGEHAPAIAAETCQKLKQSNILAGSIGNTIILVPPYVSTSQEIQYCVEATLDSLISVLRHHAR